MRCREDHTTFSAKLPHASPLRGQKPWHQAQGSACPRAGSQEAKAWAGTCALSTRRTRGLEEPEDYEANERDMHQGVGPVENVVDCAPAVPASTSIPINRAEAQRRTIPGRNRCLIAAPRLKYTGNVRRRTGPLASVSQKLALSICLCQALATSLSVATSSGGCSCRHQAACGRNVLRLWIAHRLFRHM
jgi:hypothetical protein